MLKVSIVVPCYNEASVIARSLTTLEDYFKGEGLSYEIIVVDDGSVDGTAELVSEFSSKEESIKLLRNGKNKGKGYSVRRGVLEAGGEYIFFTDADLSTPIQEMRRFLNYLGRDYDVVIGSRALKQSKILVSQNWIRKNLGRLFNFWVQVCLFKGIWDTQCGFKGFRRHVAQKIFRLQELSRFSFDAEILYIAKLMQYKINEVSVAWSNRADSRVRLFSDGFFMVVDIFRIKINSLRGLYEE